MESYSVRQVLKEMDGDCEWNLPLILVKHGKWATHYPEEKIKLMPFNRVFFFIRGGGIQAIARTRNRALASTWSNDNGKTWSDLKLLELPNNNSGTDAVTLQNGTHLLVYNHVLPPGDLAKGPRTPLNLSVSKDGIHWNAALILEDSKISQYSYPSIIQSADGMVHVVYTWRRERIKYVKIDPSKLVALPIKKGIWPGNKNKQASPTINQEE